MWSLSCPLFTETFSNKNEFTPSPSHIKAVISLTTGICHTEISNPTRKPAIVTRWWLALGPLYGFLIIIFFVWILFIIGVLVGYLHEAERQNHDQVDTETSSPTNPTACEHSYSPSYTTSSNDFPSLAYSSNNATFHQYCSESLRHESALGDPPTLAAPSTKENTAFAQ